MIEVKVPATSANMGPGFDCLGIAFNVFNTFEMELLEEGIVIEGFDEEYNNEDNLVYKSMLRCFEKAGFRYKGIRLKGNSEIPPSRGLGSSAACIVGGLVGANALCGNILDKLTLLELATEIEGHPDNVAPALYGGMTVAVKDGMKVYVDKIKITDKIKFCALIPNFKLSTELSREVLPKNIAYSDGVYNVGRVSLMIAALINGEVNTLKVACNDKLHENYRGKLIEDYDYITEESIKDGALAVFLSGAGPTIMTILDRKDNSFNSKIRNSLGKAKSEWSLKDLEIDFKGATVQHK